MKVLGVNRHEVVRIASGVGLGVEWKDDERRNRRSRHAALRPLGERYRVLVEFDDDSEQVVVCRHGHEAFLLALLTAHPTARVVTPIADYDGLRGFHEIQPIVRERYLARYGEDECNCARGA